MKKTFIWIGSVIGTGAVMALVFMALNRPSTPRTITVSGECLTSAPKDKTAITLRVEALAESTLESMRAATTQMAEITDFLKTQPVEVQTTQFNSYEKTEWNRETQKSEKLGIETNIAVEISANNIETIEKIIGQFAGKSNVYSEKLRMYTSPAVLQPIQEKCLGVALENARERANAMVSTDNKHAGKLISVSYGATSTEDNTLYGGVMRTMLSSAKAESFDMAAGTIVAKDTDVSVVVNAVFEIK